MKINNLLVLAFVMFSCGQKTEKSLHVTISQAWSTDSVFQIPESVIFDPVRNVIYVANINGDPSGKDGNGFLSRLSTDGQVQQLEWIRGLNGPKGMGIWDESLFVTDITSLVEIDLKGDSIKHSWEVEGAVFLNDITIGREGEVYISDSGNSRIYLLKNGEVSIWLENFQFNGPNGLHFKNDTLWMASFGDKQFWSISTQDKNAVVFHRDIGQGDGVESDGKGNFIVSDWSGRVFFISGSGIQTLLLDTRAQNINAADIGFISKQGMILVPTFQDNRIVAYQLNY